MTDRTVYVIGIDGVPPRLLDEARSGGFVENIDHLKTIGASGTTKTVVPPLSMAAWSSFATGRDPGGHGIYNFMLRKEGSYDTKFADGNIIHQNSIPIWDYLDERGIKSGVMNLMPGYPPSESDGFHIGDLVTSSQSSEFMYPPELKDTVEQNVANYELYPYSPYTPDKSEKDLQNYLSDLFKMERIRMGTGKYLINEKDCDFYTYVFSGSDSILHCLAHIRDEDHPHHEPELVDKYGKKPLELLEMYDEFIGWLFEQSNEEDVIMILSDHGHSSVYHQINLNSWLYNNGYLELKPGIETSLKVVGYNYVYDAFESVLHKLGLFSKLKNLVATSDSEGESKKSLKDLVTISRFDYDWDETTAYTIASGGQIYLNTQKNHPLGWITEENYDSIRESLREELLSIRHPDTGEFVIDSVYYGEEIYGSEHSETRPDLAALPSNNYQIQYPQTMKTNEIFSTPPKPGNHTSEEDRNGIFVAAGGGSDGADVEMNIEDFAPTSLALLDIPVPSSMTGNAREDIFNLDAESKSYDGRVIAKRAVRKVSKKLRK
ncbi:alkaline phosphatase family protein [Haloprofundus marisrubri]|uniref:alkaline phosphatase family protein n=1 Tax=Haloprofundus marisrubri TaxID=1514971 RepID=UPI0009E28470|nr:alkaline phosphatase family protein [Haloprofundus marisrubri]